MIDSIVLNKQRTQATIFFDDGRTFTLHHDESRVTDLVVDMFTVRLYCDEITEVIQNETDEQLSLFDYVA